MNKKITFLLLSILFGLVLIACSCSWPSILATSQPPNSPPDTATPDTTVLDLTGTRWHFVYTDPVIHVNKSYDVIFNPNGKLTDMDPNNSTPDNDAWEQDGVVVTLYFNDAYATYVGYISGSQMSGTATNIVDYTWTWEAQRVP